MRYGTAIVEKVIDLRKHVIRVRVAVERPPRPDRSYIRCSASSISQACSAAAYSGARFARHRVDAECFGIEIVEISGDLDVPDDLDGVAVATALATWTAQGVDWLEDDLVESYGWRLRATNP